MIMSEVTNATPVQTLTNPDGREIPVRSIRADVVLQHETALKIRDRFKALQEHNAAEKQAIFEMVQAYQDLIFQDYGVRVGGRVGGLTLSDYGDQVKIETSLYRYQQVTPALPAAQALINEIVEDLTEGAATDLRALVMEAFQKDETTGRINIQRLMGLKRLDLNHPKWPDAVRALNDSVAPAGSKMSVRCSERPEPGKRHEQIVVDFSRVETP